MPIIKLSMPEKISQIKKLLYQQHWDDAIKAIVEYAGGKPLKNLPYFVSFFYSHGINPEEVDDGDYQLTDIFIIDVLLYSNRNVDNFINEPNRLKVFNQYLEALASNRSAMVSLLVQIKHVYDCITLYGKVGDDHTTLLDEALRRELEAFSEHV